jgi:hypothetical protein
MNNKIQVLFGNFVLPFQAEMLKGVAQIIIGQQGRKRIPKKNSRIATLGIIVKQVLFGFQFSRKSIINGENRTMIECTGIFVDSLWE